MIRPIRELSLAAYDSAAADRAAARRAKVAELEKTMQCTCDLDNWEPERVTGHSWVCRIHKAAVGTKP